MRLVHNGYKVKFFQDTQEVEAYIEGVLNEYRHLNPTLVYKTDKVIVYRYSTLYCEIFYIDEGV